MRMEELLKTMFQAFFIITTGIIVSMYVFCLIFSPDAVFSLDDIGRILLMAVVSDLPFFLFYSRNEASKRQMLVRTAIHISVLLAILLYFAQLWDWVNIYNPKEVAVFILLVLGVYVIVYAVSVYQDKRTADKLNDSLKERYHS